MSISNRSRSVWSLPRSGHAFGALILILTVLIGIFVSGMIFATRHALRFATEASLIAAGICRLGSWLFVYFAISHLDVLGLGGWLEAVGGVVLLGGTLQLRHAAEVSQSSAFDDLIASRAAESRQPAGVINKQRLSS